jgi:WD40 repeat protein
LAISAHGRHVVAIAEDKSAVVWDLDRGERIADIVHQGRSIVGAALDATGAHLALAEDPRRITLWRLSDRTQIAATPLYDSRVGDLRFTSDGTLLVGSRQGRGVLAWAVPSLTVARTEWLAVKGDPATFFNTHDSRQYVVDDTRTPAQLRRYREDLGAESGSRIDLARVSRGPIALSPSTRLVAMGDGAGRVRLVDLSGKGREEVFDVALGTSGARSVLLLAFLAETQLLAAVEDGSVAIWDVVKKTTLQRLNRGSTFVRHDDAMLFPHTGHLVLVPRDHADSPRLGRFDDRSIKVLDTKTSRIDLIPGYRAARMPVDDALLVVSALGRADGKERQQIAVWPLNSRQPRSTHSVEMYAAEGIAVHPEGRWLLYATVFGALVRLDLSTLKVAMEYKPHGSRTSCLTWSPDGRHFLHCTQDGAAVYSLERPVAVAQMETGGKWAADGVFDPKTGDVFLATLGSLTRHDAKTGRVRKQIAEFEDRWRLPAGVQVYSLTFARKGTLLAAGVGGGRLVIFERRGDEFTQVRDELGHYEEIVRLRESSDDRWVVASGLATTMFDTKNLTSAIRLFAFPDDRFTAIAPTGWFDTNDFATLRGFAWNQPGRWRDPFPFERFTYPNFQPSLVDRVVRDAVPATLGSGKRLSELPSRK